MRYAVYFGSFNPMHIGHMAIVEYLEQRADIDKVLLVVSPKNPLKKGEILSDAKLRLQSVIDYFKHHVSLKKVEVSDIEFHLTEPLYTINTLTELSNHQPNDQFILIIGADNLAIIEKWHDYQNLLQRFETWVFPRTGFDADALCKKYGATLIDAPLVDVSSTMIREGEERGEDMGKFLPV